MATLNQGILGGFSGKVGPVVGSNWRGKQVLRSAPSKSTKPISAAACEGVSRTRVRMLLYNRYPEQCHIELSLP